MSGISNPVALAEVLQYAAPTAGQTVTVLTDTTILILEPAGLLATLTVNFSAGAPGRGEGATLRVVSTQVITALTMGAGAGNTLLGALTASVANGFAEYVYRQAKWYRCG